MIEIDISTETLSDRDGGKLYLYYFLDKATQDIYKVISGGAGCLARSVSEVESRVKNKFTVKHIQPNIKSHRKYFQQCEAAA